MFWGTLAAAVGAAAAAVVSVVLLLCSLRESPLLKKEEIKGGRNKGRWELKGMFLGGFWRDTQRERG